MDTMSVAVASRGLDGAAVRRETDEKSPLQSNPSPVTKRLSHKELSAKKYPEQCLKSRKERSRAQDRWPENEGGHGVQARAFCSGLGTESGRWKIEFQTLRSNIGFEARQGNRKKESKPTGGREWNGEEGSE